MPQSPADFTDFYALLEVDPSADGAVIDKALHREHRRWGARQNSPDPTKRAEAEHTVRRLTEAERVLGDPRRRAAYDEQRAAHRAAPAAEARSAPRSVAAAQPAHEAEDWVAQARKLLGAGAAEAGRVAAQRAVQAQPGNPAAWWVLADALFLGGDLAQAASTYGEAAKLAPRVVGLRLSEARCLMLAGKFQTALQVLAIVADIAPDDVDATQLTIQCLLGSDQLERALPLAERYADAHPGDEVAQRLLARALIKLGTSCLTQTGPDSYMPTTRDQVSRAQAAFTRAASLRFTDDELRQEIASWSDFLTAATRRVFRSSNHWGWWIAGLVFGLFAMSNDTGGQFIGFLWLAVIGTAFYVRHWRPQWQLNAKSLAKS